MKFDEILPLGFSVESVLIHLMNENYTVNLNERNGKVVLVSEHFTTKQCQCLSR